MNKILRKKIVIWIFLSINLLVVFFLGLKTLFIDIIVGLISGFVIVSLFAFLIYLLLGYFEENSIDQIFSKKVTIWVMLTLNLLFSFIIGVTIPFMQSKMWIRYNMAFVLLPILIILNYIILDRFHYHIKHAIRGEKEIIEKEEKKKDVPVIEFEGKKYIFSIRSIAILAIGAPVLSIAIYLFFDAEMNYWLHEISVKHTVLILNLLGVKAKAVYMPVGKDHWIFYIPGRGSIYFHTFCSGIQGIAVFCGIIIFTPHSQDPKTKEDIFWRKTKALIVSSLLFYVVNIIRMIIELYLFHIGYAWADIAYPIAAASSFLAAIILLMMHKWNPEFMISIIYAGTLIRKKVKGES